MLRNSFKTRIFTFKGGKKDNDIFTFEETLKGV